MHTLYYKEIVSIFAGSVIDHQDFQMAQILEEIRQQVFKITATQPTKLTSIFVYISKI